MRGADAGPQHRLCALSAFWVGLLYDDTALDGAWELVKSWNAAERQALRAAVPMQGLKAPIRNTTAQAIAKEAVKLSIGGLKRRKQLNAAGKDETIFMAELEEIADSGVTAAERLLAMYHGPWQRDLRLAFKDVLIDAPA
jgi:glutamate--cysteine ligase